MTPWQDLHFWIQTFNAVFGAGLGAAFYILLNTQSYLSNRSFDPKYNAIYAARFITGLIAGVILATALGPFVSVHLSIPIGSGVLAILGGYAAEAVQQILQRLVEIVLTAVRGDGAAQIQTKVAAAQTQLSARVQKIMMDYERETDPAKKKALLDQIYTLLSAPP